MHLTKLFEMQRVLDAEVELRHPILPGEDRSAKLNLALQVELGELANEWRGFKFWSNDQEARTSRTSVMFGEIIVKNPLLEEFVDCLHFILSIGLKIEGAQAAVEFFKVEAEIAYNITMMFHQVLEKCTNLFWGMYYKSNDTEFLYLELVRNFLGLGKMLGFTWEEIESAYFEKNKINHERQNNGY